MGALLLAPLGLRRVDQEILLAPLSGRSQRLALGTGPLNPRTTASGADDLVLPGLRRGCPWANGLLFSFRSPLCLLTSSASFPYITTLRGPSSGLLCFMSFSTSSNRRGACSLGFTVPGSGPGRALQSCGSSAMLASRIRRPRRESRSSSTHRNRRLEAPDLQAVNRGT